MGAVTALLYTSDSNFTLPIQGMVLDSPFSDTTQMIADVMNHQTGIPKFMIKTALMPIGSSIKSYTGEDVMSVSPISVVQDVKVPAFYMVAKNDTVARLERVQKLYEKHDGKGNKYFLKMEGEHNDFRSYADNEKALKFLSDIAE